MSEKDDGETNEPDADAAAPTAEQIAQALQPGNDNRRSESDGADAGADAVPAEATDEAEPDPFVVLERLKAENEDLKDQLLRTAAETQNVRKRAERERQETRQYAVTGFARDIVSVADNLSRALTAVSDEEKGGMDEAIKNLIDGVEMTERELLKVFERHEITRIDPVGERFDPNLHEAMFEAENPEFPAGVVTSVVQCGYRISDRVLRPAMVGVSKGNPNESGPEETAEIEGES